MKAIFDFKIGLSDILSVTLIINNVLQLMKDCSALFLMDFRKGVKRSGNEDKKVGDKRTESKKGKS
jgi:hypothetical protein